MNRTTLVAAALACGLVAIADAQTDFDLREEHTINRVLRFGGTGIRTLDARTTNGSIRVTADDGSDVRIDATQRIAGRTRDDLAAAQRDAVLETTGDAATITVFARDADRSLCNEPWDGRSGNRAWWDRRRYEVSYDLAIRVPRATRLRLCTINGGEIIVDGTTEDFDVSNVNGRITMENVRGTGRATTVNGAVTIGFAAAPKTDALFKTVNGDVAVTLPANASADLRMKTLHGDLLTDFEVEVVQLKPAAGARRNGRFVYRSNQFTTARIGSGGPEMTFETVNGDVRVRRAK